MTKEEAINELSVLWERMKRAKESGVLAYKTIMYYDGQYVEALDMAIKALEQTKWIPVSERLPEVDGRYLTTCSKIGKWEVDWNIWYNEPKPSWLWEQGVTAWMPLPEPYRGIIRETRAREMEVEK